MKIEHGLIAAMVFLVGSVLALIAADPGESQPPSSIGISETLKETVKETQPAVTVTMPKVEEPPASIAEFSGTVSVPAGTSVPGCEETNECYIPAEITISVGDTVTWSNDDTAAHTVTSGLVTEGPDGEFDSSLFMAGATFEHTFDSPGEYDYFCMVHPWMTGKVTVN